MIFPEVESITYTKVDYVEDYDLYRSKHALQGFWVENRYVWIAIASFKILSESKNQNHTYNNASHNDETYKDWDSDDSGSFCRTIIFLIELIVCDIPSELTNKSRSFRCIILVILLSIRDCKKGLLPFPVFNEKRTPSKDTETRNHMYGSLGMNVWKVLIEQNLQNNPYYKHIREMKWLKAKKLEVKSNFLSEIVPNTVDIYVPRSTELNEGFVV